MTFSGEAAAGRRERDAALPPSRPPRLSQDVSSWSR